MEHDAYLGMELDVVLEHLHLNGKEVDIQYTVPPRNSFSGVARILKVHSAGEKFILTVSYETGRKGGVW